MTTQQLDEFQAWLNAEAGEADKKTVDYFYGRAGAFRDAFEYLSILKMQSGGAVVSEIPKATEDEASADWKLSVDWLKSMADAVEQSTTERPSIEIIEDIAQALIEGGWAIVKSPNAPALPPGEKGAR